MRPVSTAEKPSIFEKDRMWGSLFFSGLKQYNESGWAGTDRGDPMVKVRILKKRFGATIQLLEGNQLGFAQLPGVARLLAR